MEQKFVGSAEFNLAEAVYARCNPKNHGWLKKKLENVRRSSCLSLQVVLLCLAHRIESRFKHWPRPSFQALQFKHGSKTQS